MKYIKVENEETGKKEIFVFPRWVDHDVMAESILFMRNHTHGNWTREARMPLSAGFVTPEGVCYGRSETLNLDSSEEDTNLLKSQNSAMY